MANVVENLGKLERRVTISLPKDAVQKEVDSRIRQLAKNVRMPGFRPGKVPLKMVAQQYGPQVRSDVIADAVQTRFNDAVRAQNLRVAGYPKIEQRAANADAGKWKRGGREIGAEIGHAKLLLERQRRTLSRKEGHLDGSRKNRWQGEGPVGQQTPPA